MDLQGLLLNAVAEDIPVWSDRILLQMDLNYRGDDERIRGCMVLMILSPQGLVMRMPNVEP